MATDIRGPARDIRPDEVRVWRVEGTNGREALVTGPYSVGAAVRLAALAGVEEGRATRVDVRQVWVREKRGGI